MGLPIPDSPKIRVAFTYALGKKYRPTRQAVPRIRGGVGADGDEVQQTYRQMYSQPMDTIFATRSGTADSIRWAWTELGIGSTHYRLFGPPLA